MLAYHDLSKHHRHAYAPAPPALDWANQPDPFRTFAGAPAVEMPLLADALRTSYADLYDPAPAGPRRADVNSVAVLFELALGLSAWKEHGTPGGPCGATRRAATSTPPRGTPSSPTSPGSRRGVPLRRPGPRPGVRRRLAPAETAARALPPGCLLVGLSSVHWREAWKYGAGVPVLPARRRPRLGRRPVRRRRPRVVGPAPGPRRGRRRGRLARAWTGTGSPAWTRPTGNTPPPSSWSAPPPCPTPPVPPPPAGGPWLGRANRLSPDPARWDQIDAAAAAARRRRRPRNRSRPGRRCRRSPPAQAVPSAALIRQRRSCLALDGRTALAPARHQREIDAPFQDLSRRSLRQLVEQHDWRGYLYAATRSFVHA